MCVCVCAFVCVCVFLCVLTMLSFSEGETFDVLFMEEPNLATDMDRWSEWYENLKAIRAYLEN